MGKFVLNANDATYGRGIRAIGGVASSIKPEAVEAVVNSPRDFTKGVGSVFVGNGSITDSAAKFVNPATSQVAKGAQQTAQGIISAPERIVRSVAELPFGDQGTGVLTSNKVAGIPGTEGLAKNLYGGEIKSYQQTSKELEDTLEKSDNGLLRGAAPLAPFAAPVLAFGDATALGGATAGTSAIAKQAPKVANEAREAYRALPQEVREGGYAKLPGETPKVQPTTKLVQPKAVVDEQTTAPSQTEDIVIPGEVEATLPKIEVPSTRGFTKTVFNNDRTSNEVRQGLINKDTSYTVRNTNDLQLKAANLVKEKPDEAIRIARIGADDNAVAVAQELMKKFQREGKYQEAIDVVENLAPKLTEAGRSAQAASIYGRLTPEGSLRFAQRNLDRYNETNNLQGTKRAVKLSPDKAKQIDEIALKVNDLPDGDDKTIAILELQRLTNNVAPTPTLEKLTNIWRAGLLTSARTLEGGVVGNASKGLLDVPSQLIGAGADRFITAPLFNKGVRSNVFTLKDTLQGAREGVGRGKDYLKTGLDPRDAGRGYDRNVANYEGGGALNTLGKGSDYVYRAMGAVDNPFYYAGLGRAKNEQALIEASKRGLKGREARQFADNYVKDLSGDDLAAAENTAREGVFQNDTALGTIASGLKRAPQSIPDPQTREGVQAIVDFVIPFSKIPSAVATALVDYSPAGVVLQAAKQGLGKGPADLRKINSAIGKSTTGSIGGVWLGTELYNKGLLTLEEPADPKEAELWKLQGKQKFSIKIGDKWRSLNYVQPLGGLLALGGGYEQAKKDGADNPLLTAAATGVKSVGEQSFLQGVKTAVESATNPKEKGSSYANSLAGSVIPNFVKDIARATDSKEREVNNPLDAVRNGIPGVRQQNTPQKDPFGRDVARKQSPAGVLLDPFKSTQSKGDVVTDELARLYEKDPEDLGIVPSKLKKDQAFAGQTARLTPEQLDDFEGRVGKKAFDDLKKEISKPEWELLPDEQKSKAIKSIIDTNRNNPKEQFTKDYDGQLKDKKGNTLAFDNSKLKQKTANVTGETKSSSPAPKNNAEAYNKALKDYEKNSSKFSQVDRIKADKEIAALKVKKDYDKDITDLYSLNKQAVHDFVTTDKNGQAIQDKLIEYGDAQVNAGLTSKNKFRDKDGNIAVLPKGGSTTPTVERYRPQIEKYFPKEEATKALWVIAHESAGKENALGDGGHSYGLFQNQHIKQGANVEEQIKDAKRLYDQNKKNGGTGWGDWGEGTNYQGKKFGSLGNHPYPGDAEAKKILAGMMSDSSVSGASVTGSRKAKSTKSTGRKSSGGRKGSTTKSSTKPARLYDLFPAKGSSTSTQKALQNLLKKYR